MGGEEVPKSKNMESPVPQRRRWYTSIAKSVTRSHLQGVVTASIVTLAGFSIYRNRNGRKNAPIYQRSQSIGALHGGKVAVQRILDAQHARIDPSVLDAAEAELKGLLSKGTLDFSQLQSVVAKLEMSGKEEKAVETLSEAQKRFKEKGHHHEAYELDMLIVEMLIYKGDYEKALERECLKDEQISDARRPLYKAVILILKAQTTEAQKCWNDLKEKRSNFQWPDSILDEPVDAVMEDFKKFENTVNLLKKEIDRAHNKAK